MAWESSDRRAGLPANWGTLTREVWKRDRGQCTWRLPSGKRCPRKGADVDHRNGRDDHSLRNLQLLCRAHHDKKTQAEARWGRMKRKQGRKRRQERHPGDLR